MKNNNLVSIITPMYNAEKYIDETIKIVQCQTYSNWEMIIVDDCSTDKCAEIVKSYMEKDSRIKYYSLNKNSGPAAARTKAMKMATGKYMAFLDSDDIWKKEKLEKQINFMKKNDYAFSCTSYEQVDENRVPLNKVINCIEKCDYNRALLDNPIGNSTVMYDVEKMGKFEVPNIRKRNDFALWLKMLKNEKYIWGLPEILVQYRVRKDSISSNKLDLIKYQWDLYRNIEHLSVLRSSFHICYYGVIKILKIK